MTAEEFFALKIGDIVGYCFADSYNYALVAETTKDRSSIVLLWHSGGSKFSVRMRYRHTPEEKHPGRGAPSCLAYIYKV
jgi:hypothetical protein